VNEKVVRPIIVVKRVRKAEGHHGGAWKVAYADFVTAMMAFFLVMWLVASVTKEQRAAIFEYFKNPSMEQGKSTRAAPGANGPGGASTSVINMHGGLDSPKAALRKETGLTAGAQNLPNPAASVEAAQRVAAEAEHRQLESLMEELRKAIDQSQALRPFKDQLLLDITPEGLRIQIVDAQNRPMFDLGKARLKDYTATILHELAPYLNTVSNRISLSGHTDTTPYVAQNGYTNWDLSADRANAARRALESGGLHTEKIARVIGLSSAVLFDKENARNPINRRISIIVMTKKAEESALRTDTPNPGAAAGPAEGAATPPAGAGPGADATGTAQAPAPAATAPAAPAPAAMAAAVTRPATAPLTQPVAARPVASPAAAAAVPTMATAIPAPPPAAAAGAAVMHPIIVPIALPMIAPINRPTPAAAPGPSPAPAAATDAFAAAKAINSAIAGGAAPTSRATIAASPTTGAKPAPRN
jgi:chemotaxis protein MotB